MRRSEQWVCGIASLLMIAPGLVPTLVGVAIASPVVLRHVVAMRRGT
jgi:UPF0716 family protein affecting phage T7 exclusion